MVKLRYKIGFVVAVLGAVFLWGRCSRQSGSSPTNGSNNAPPALPAGDTEQITVDPSRHTISMLTPTGRRTETLPDRVSTIDVRKDGSVKVTAPQMGFETHPFVGLGYGQGTRLYLGTDLGYYKKADLGLGVGTPDLFDRSGARFNDIRLGMFVSYTVYSNTRATLGVDIQKAVHFLLSVRI